MYGIDIYYYGIDELFSESQLPLLNPPSSKKVKVVEERLIDVSFCTSHALYIYNVSMLYSLISGGQGHFSAFTPCIELSKYLYIHRGENTVTPPKPLTLVPL